MQTRPRTAEMSRFGALLKEWRQVRRMSQLSLAVEAGVSSKHVSFLETGRSSPSREMVLRLAEVLDVPLRHCNTLMRAAGYVGPYGESPLEDPALDPIRRSIEKLLERQNPFPAIVCDRHFHIKMQNRSALELLALMVDVESLPPEMNAVRLLFSEEAMRPFVVNWSEVASAMIQRLHREIAVFGADEESTAILEEALAAPGVPSQWRLADLDADLPVVVPLHLRRGDVDLRFFTALATLGTALDVTLSELVIETFLPADDDSEQRLQELFGD